MIDFRLYRLAFAPALVAAVVVMFSLEGPPDPLQPAVAPATFEGERAAGLARQIAASEPDRRAGGAGDAAIADLVAQRFGAVRAGTASESRFSVELDGEEVELRNVLLTLPGDPASTIVVLAARDSSDGPGAASSAAATGVLVELASALGVAGHERTLVLASTTALDDTAAGARAVLAALPDPGTVDAVVIISQPGAPERRQPFVVVTSADETSGSAQLAATAEVAVETHVNQPPGEGSAFAQLARLAIPSGVGPQAPLVAEGIDAVTISAAGERPLAPELDDPDDLSGANVDGFGRAVQATVAALDGAGQAPVHGPATYVEVGGNLVPGWTLALLAAALIVPALAAAIDGLARAARRGLEPVRSLGWALARTLPFVGALAALYALALVGLVPRPAFPFDPGDFGLGGRAAISFALLALVFAASAYLLHTSPAGASAAPAAAPVACGLLAALAVAAIWIENPYLALVLVPAAHVWLLATADPSRVRRLAVGLAAVLAVLPAAAAFASVAAALDLGSDAPWTLTLMLSGGQLGLGLALPACFILAALATATMLAAPSQAPPQAPVPGPGPG